MNELDNAIVTANECLSRVVIDKRDTRENHNDAIVSELQTKVAALLGLCRGWHPVLEYRYPRDSHNQTFAIDITLLSEPPRVVGRAKESQGKIESYARGIGPTWAVARNHYIDGKPWVVFDTAWIREFVHFKTGVRSLNGNRHNHWSCVTGDLIRLEHQPVPQLALTLSPRYNPVWKKGWAWHKSNPVDVTSSLERHRFDCPTSMLRLPFTIDQETWTIAEFPDWTRLWSPSTELVVPQDLGSKEPQLFD